MSILQTLRHLPALLGSDVGKAFHAAQSSGLTDKVMSDAVVWVKVAANKQMENPTKQAWVANILIARGVPTSIANLAVELAVQLIKYEEETK